MKTEAIVLKRTIEASPEAVFEAWLDPKMLSRFMIPAPGVTISRVEVDAQEGGSFLVVMKVGEKEMPHYGEYLVIDRYKRLVFTWKSENAGTHSQVHLSFEPLAPARTRIVLRHENLPNEKERSGHEKGWTSILGSLSSILDGKESRA